MNLINDIQKKLFDRLEKTPSDFLDAWIVDNAPTTEALEAELERTAVIDGEAASAFENVKRQRAEKAEERWRDGEQVRYDLVDGSAPEFKTLYAKWASMAKQHFGCEADCDGHTRGVRTEARLRRVILLTHLDRRRAAGDLSAPVVEALDAIRERKIDLLDLDDVVKPLHVRATIDPERFGADLEVARAARDAKLTEINVLRTRLLLELGYQGTMP